jgi:tryptophanyl-tRNA synthetase
MPRFLSGIQPSGRLHLGNYYGAIRDHVALQEQGEAYYFIADYHALTTLKDPAALRRNVVETAVTYLACGLDPARCVLYRQSDVPEVTELTWLLLTVAPMAMLENAVSYKDKVARGIPSDAGLFTYPVLMAADILAQGADVVPVGRDQVQHVEMTRDLASKFNRTYGTEAFKVPEYRLGDAPYVPGTDGAKMSKSYGNAIEIFAEGKELERAVMGIKTDSLAPEAKKDPDASTVQRIYALTATPAERDAMAERYRAGGLGYGDAKKALLRSIESAFAPIRERGKALRADVGRLDAILREGAEKARSNARAVLARARAACGLS